MLSLSTLGQNGRASLNALYLRRTFCFHLMCFCVAPDRAATSYCDGRLCYSVLVLFRCCVCAICLVFFNWLSFYAVGVMAACVCFKFGMTLPFSEFTGRFQNISLTVARRSRVHSAKPPCFQQQGCIARQATVRAALPASDARAGSVAVAVGH